MGTILKINCSGCELTCEAIPYMSEMLAGMLASGGQPREIGIEILRLNFVFVRCQKTGKFGLMRIGG